jgi:hypothetical protein
MEAIKDTIKNVLGSLAAKQGASGGDSPEAMLKKVFSKQEAGHVRFGYLKKGILGLVVDSSTWLYYLNLQKASLLAKLRKESHAVKDIRFSVGEME